MGSDPEGSRKRKQGGEAAVVQPGRNSALGRLAADGRIIPARLDLTELGPPKDVPRKMTISEALAEQRREE